MPRLGKPGTLALLMIGGVLAWAAGHARMTTVRAQATQLVDPPVPSVHVYVSDFELPAVGPPAPQKKGPAATTSAKPIESEMDAADTPSLQAQLLTDRFAETLGAGSTNSQFLLYVGTFNLKSPDRPLYQPAAVQSHDPHYGPVITLNAYIPLEKFELAKNPVQGDLQRVCTEIAQGLSALLGSNREAFAN